jgi:hypothetical protein
MGNTAATVLDAITAGSIAAERSLYGPYCPVGTVFDPSYGTCLPGFTGNVTATGSSGVWILVAIGAVLLFMSREALFDS